jgi:uracil-DNA glycosylase family 4
MITLNVLHENNKSCTSCSISRERKQVVVGSGSPKAEFMIVGEFSSKEDELIGEPFQGLEGSLLYKYLKKTGFNNNLYITNLVKCHSKYTPEKESIQACKKWLWQEIQTINPTILLCLGKTSTKLLFDLKSNFTMKEVVGIIHKRPYMETKVIAWYHPSYLLNRGQTLEKETIQCFVKIKEYLNEIRMA